MPENQEKFDVDAFLKRFKEPIDTDSDEYNKKRYKDFLKIRRLLKMNVRVMLTNREDAKKIGLDEDELTDYLRLKVKNNFANIRMEEVDFSKNNTKSFKQQVGSLHLNVWVVGDNYPVAYHLRYVFFTSDYSEGDSSIWDTKWLGYGSKDNISDIIKSNIDKTIQDLAILFFKVRGEL